MNVMAQAHKDVREAFANAGSGVKLNYRSLFAKALKIAHKEYKAMNKEQAIAAYKADTIAKFEQRIVELNQYVLTSGESHKWMVVCGDDHPMPMNFDDDRAMPWATTEQATKWASPQFARSAAQRVMNGNMNVGKAVLVADHVEWDIANLQKLIANLKAS